MSTYLIVEKETKIIYTYYDECAKSRIPEFYFTEKYIHIPIPEEFLAYSYSDYVVQDDYTLALPEYIINEIEASQWKVIRERRNVLLSECDWRMCQDIPLDVRWVEYRQKLRDIPSDFKKASDVVFPIPPA